MIQCEGCEEWFHYSCLGRSREEVDTQPSFHCDDVSGGVVSSWWRRVGSSWWLAGEGKRRGERD